MRSNWAAGLALAVCGLALYLQQIHGELPPRAHVAGGGEEGWLLGGRQTGGGSSEGRCQGAVCGAATARWDAACTHTPKASPPPFEPCARRAGLQACHTCRCNRLGNVPDQGACACVWRVCRASTCSANLGAMT